MLAQKSKNKRQCDWSLFLNINAINAIIKNVFLVEIDQICGSNDITIF